MPHSKKPKRPEQMAGGVLAREAEPLARFWLHLLFDGDWDLS
jgi:hypothetical protein